MKNNIQPTIRLKNIGRPSKDLFNSTVVIFKVYKDRKYMYIESLNEMGHSILLSGNVRYDYPFSNAIEEGLSFLVQEKILKSFYRKINI